MIGGYYRISLERLVDRGSLRTVWYISNIFLNSNRKTVQHIRVTSFTNLSFSDVPQHPNYVPNTYLGQNSDDLERTTIPRNLICVVWHSKLSVNYVSNHQGKEHQEFSPTILSHRRHLKRRSRPKFCAGDRSEPSNSRLTEVTAQPCSE